MNVDIARKWLMAELSAKRGRQRIVEERAAKGECLKDDCGQKASKRGLCPKHRNQYYNSLRGMSDEEKIGFEQAAIREGLILPVGAARKYKPTDNPFELLKRQQEAS